MRLTFTQTPDAIEPATFTAEGRTLPEALDALEAEFRFQFSSNGEPADPLGEQAPLYRRNRAVLELAAAGVYRRRAGEPWMRPADFTITVEAEDDGGWSQLTNLARGPQQDRHIIAFWFSNTPAAAEWLAFHEAINAAERGEPLPGNMTAASFDRLGESLAGTW